jgi:hypothetical protein
MASYNDVREAMLDEILRQIQGQTPMGLVLLAEAAAWIQAPAQPHGGAAVSAATK